MKKIFSILIVFAMIFGGCKGKENKVEFSTKETNKSERSWGNAPDFTLEKIEGGTLTLSDYKGKLIILNFWATWCPPCRMEIPSFVELQNKYKDHLIIIGINLDQDNPENVKQFIKKFNINYPVVKGTYRVVLDYGEIRGIPTTFIIDSNGNIRETIVGYRPKEIFESLIKQYGEF